MKELKIRKEHSLVKLFVIHKLLNKEMPNKS